MKVLDRRSLEEETSDICLINKLVESSFGKGFKANYHPVYNDPYSCFIAQFEELHPDRIAERPDSVGWIAKKLILNRFKLAAKFLREGADGSKLELQETFYLPAAKEYARLYEERFKKEVTIVMK